MSINELNHHSRMEDGSKAIAGAIISDDLHPFPSPVSKFKSAHGRVHHTVSQKKLSQCLGFCASFISAPPVKSMAS